MFTRNYWMVRAAAHVSKYNEVIGDGSAIKPKLITVSGAEGEDVYSTFKYSSVQTPIDSALYYYLRNVKTADVSQNRKASDASSDIGNYAVVFGSGNTPATIDDYKLSGDVIQNISFSYTDNSTYKEDGSEGVASYTYTITNNNDTDITIGEVGLFSEATWQTNYSSSTKYTHHYYMYERTALESPITIPANGGVGQVTYTIKMEYPVPPIEE